MEDLKRKIRFVFIPYLLVSAGYIIIYTFLDWLLFIQFKTLNMQPLVIRCWIPMATYWIFVYLFLWRRLKKLRLKNPKKEPQFGIVIVMCVVMLPPVALSQIYIAEATGKLSTLENIDELNISESTRYYTLKNHYFDKRDAGLYTVYRTSGKGNNTFNVELFYTVPIFEKESDTTKRECSAWLGVKYRDYFNNRIDQSEKDKRCRMFEQQAHDNFKTINLDSFSYLQQLDYDENTAYYNSALKFSSKYFENNTFILKRCYGAFEDRTDNNLTWIIVTFGLGATLVFLCFLPPTLSEADVEEFKSKRSNKNKVY